MTTTIVRATCLAVVVVLSGGGTLLAAGKSLKIAMVLWRGETDGEKGFKEGLQALGYSVHYTIMDARQDRTELGRLLREDLQPTLRTFDYIYTFGTTVSKETRTIVADQIPHVFNIVADPVEVGIVQSMESSGGNISGASNAIPLPLQIETALKIFPFTRLGLFFNPHEKNSLAVRERLIRVAKHYRVDVIDLPSPRAQDRLHANLLKVRNKSLPVDAVYLPQDSFLVSNAKHIGSELRAAKVMSIATIKDYVDHGALMGIVADYYQLGKVVAAIVDRHQQGEKLERIAIATDPKPRLVVNRATGKALDIRIPDDLKVSVMFVE